MPASTNCRTRVNTSLYFEEKPRRGAPVRYLSQTDPLDAWVLSERGHRSSAKKPRQKLEQRTERLLDTLATERPPGWIAAGCSFLDVSGDSREQMFRELRVATRRARERHKVQRGTLLFKDVPGGLVLCWIVVPDEGRGVLRAYLESYVAERLEEHDVERVLGVGLTPSSNRSYDALLVLEPSRWDAPAVA